VTAQLYTAAGDRTQRDLAAHCLTLLGPLPRHALLADLGAGSGLSGALIFAAPQQCVARVAWRSPLSQLTRALLRKARCCLRRATHGLGWTSAVLDISHAGALRGWLRACARLQALTLFAPRTQAAALGAPAARGALALADLGQRLPLRAGCLDGAVRQQRAKKHIVTEGCSARRAAP
jgi:hypothetical protein